MVQVVHLMNMLNASLGLKLQSSTFFFVYILMLLSASLWMPLFTVCMSFENHFLLVWCLLFSWVYSPFNVYQQSWPAFFLTPW